MGYTFEKACAKINLCLDITGVRDDGFHEIKSVMQCVEYGDDVTVETTYSNGITLECSDRSLPMDERNLAVKAALAFFKYTEKPFGVKINIKKNIPDKAGLAGGSADAAAVLRALNTLSGGELSDEELREIAAGVGSDVVFCVSSDPSFVSGRGEVIEPDFGLSDCFIVLAKGKDGISTPEAYRSLDGMYGDFASRTGVDKIREIIKSGDLERLGCEAFNIFESVVCPKLSDVDELKSIMREKSSYFTMMSGSGSAVFGVFEREADANAAAEKIKSNGVWAVVTRPLQ